MSAHLQSADDQELETPLVSFYQLLRELQNATGKRVGYDTPPREEPLRLRADLDAHFPVNELARWREQDKVLDVSFFGLFGPCGALPQHYTQVMQEQARIKDFALRDFLDMFNHRLISYFYRVWEKHQFAVGFETAASTGAEDIVTQALWALLGNRTPGTRDRLHVPDSVFLYYAGHLSNRRPSADGLRVTLQHAFGMRTCIDQFVGQWMFLSDEDKSRMGSPATGHSLGNQLGIDSVLGSRVWDNQNKFRVRLGPVSWSKFQELNPLADLLRRIADFTRRVVGPQFDFDIQVTVDRHSMRGMQLGDPGSSRLGWNTWVGRWDRPHDAEDAIFQLSDSES